MIREYCANLIYSMETGDTKSNSRVARLAVSLRWQVPFMKIVTNFSVSRIFRDFLVDGRYSKFVIRPCGIRRKLSSISRTIGEYVASHVSIIIVIGQKSVKSDRYLQEKPKST